MERRFALVMTTLAFAACGGGESPPEPDADATAEPPSGLPRVHDYDTVAAARGERLLTDAWPGRGVIPSLALRHLYLSWTEDLSAIYRYYTDATEYWAAFDERYGTHRPQAGALPLGFVTTDDGDVSLTCLVCHAAPAPDGPITVGLANSRLDLQALYDDLMALPAAFEALKQRPLSEPYQTLVASIPVPPTPPALAPMTARTGAAGANDAMGLGITFGAIAAGRDDVGLRLGFQTPAAWWQTSFKERRYADGSVAVGGHRAMMATLLGLGMEPAQLVSLDEAFADVEDYLVSLPSPRWPFSTPDPGEVELGRARFAEACARCHGTYEGPDAVFPNRIVPVEEIGTDPLRVTRFGELEADLVNDLIRDPEHPMEPTGGYLAPPLSGVWATAPYLHNGSVPDLMAVLDPASRPARWQRTGWSSDDFDRERVGWRYTVPPVPPPASSPPPTVEARRVYETGQAGLSNAGHTMGSGLSEAERRALLAYLVTL